MKLNLGCGDRIIPGFVNVDVRNLDGVDKIEDATTLPSFEADSVDLIYCCHVLEHFPRHRRMDTLRRWYYILKAGGLLRIAVPDFEKVVQMYSGGMGVDALIGFLYGGQDYDGNFHYYCWDFQSLKKDLEQANFVEVERYDWRQTEHAGIDDYSQCYLPHMQKETGTLMSLNVEARKVG